MKKTVLITGVSRGLGLGLANHFAKQGDHVVGLCRNPKPGSLLENIELFSCDVRDEKRLETLSQKLTGKPIDILINNAGILNSKQDECWGQSKHSDAFATRKELLEVLDINTVSPLRIVDIFLPHLFNGKEKLIVNLSSGAGSISQNQSGGHMAYRMSKAALNMGMQEVAIRFKEKGIHVLLLSPGWVQTEMGGKKASLSVNESVCDLTQIIENYRDYPSGGFFTHKGKPIPF